MQAARARHRASPCTEAPSRDTSRWPPQRIGNGVVAEILHADGDRKGAPVQAPNLDSVPAGHLGILGEPVLHAELVRDVCHHVVARAVHARRLLGRTAHARARVPLGIAVGLQVQLLRAHCVGQQDVRILGGIGHHGVPNQNELALALVGKNIVHLVDIAMLVSDAVARIVPQELDVVAQLVDTGDARIGGSHLLAVVDGVKPLVAWDARFNGVLVGRQTADQRNGRLGLALAGIGVGKADFAEQNGNHANRTAGILAVGVMLRAPAPNHERSLGGGQVGSKLANGVGRDLRDRSGPLGGLLDHIVAGAHDVVLVGLILALGAFRHALLVAAHAVRM